MAGTDPAIPSFPRFSRPERLADAAVHLVGLAFGLAACIVLTATGLSAGGALRFIALAIYAAGLMAMLGFSALYNLHNGGRWKALFRRLDHAAIFVMIAGTFTPFALISIGTSWAAALLIFMWLVAGVGVAVKLLYPGQYERLAIIAYLLLGWTPLVFVEPLLAAISLTGFVLLATGGALYSLGVLFHLARRLPYQNAVWHLFVLAAAACHFAAVMIEVGI